MEAHQEESVVPETGETAAETMGERLEEEKSINGNFEDNAIDSDLKMHLEEWERVAHERPLRIMVCGLGGVGKSTLINRLLQLKDGEKWAEEGRQGEACSSAVAKYERTTERGIKVCLFDTPGFDDIHMKDEVIIAMIEKETEKKLDVIFYCLSLEGPARVQRGDARAIRIMTQAFGSQIWNKAVVVLTFANELEEKRSICSAVDYWNVIRNITGNVKAVLQKEQVSDDIIKELPIQTAGHTEPVLRYEEEECEKIGGWDNRLFLEALKQVDPAVLPALLAIRFGLKDVVAALGGGGGGALMGACIGGAAGVVMGPPGVLVGAAGGAAVGAAVGGAGGASLGVLAYQLMKIKSVLRIKYIKWKLDRKPTSPRQASTEN